MCVCPAGFYGSKCETPLYTKCVVNLNTFDSFVDFSKVYTFTYKLNCRKLTAEGHVQVTSESVGYKYSDVISLDPIAVGEKVFGQVAATKAVLTFDFRDWRWLTNVQRFQQDIDDPLILSGEKDGSIEVDFRKMRDSDLAGDTKFEVKGRLYYEAHIFGNKISSFTTSGFFDNINSKIIK